MLLCIRSKPPCLGLDVQIGFVQANNMRPLHSYPRNVISKDDKDMSVMQHLTSTNHRCSTDDIIDVKAVLVQEHQQ